jgi:carboxyl-terminal processing protease
MPRTIKTVIITLLLVVSLALSFGAGCALETRNTSSADQGLGVIEEGWNLIFQDYVARESLNATTLSQGALKGMVEALDDPYSAYLDAPTYQKSRSDMAGKYEGIGAYVGVKDGQIMIIAPIPDSPAAKAGIKAGDIVLEIDGNSASEMSLEEAVLHIRGPEGTSVRLLILHQGETEPEEIEIVRSEIPISSVYLEMREDIAHIYITNFSERTNEELSTVLENVAKEAATGIILDLRSNPGGLLDAVINVASRFLKEGIVLYVVDNQGNKSSFSARPGGVTTELPLVVLTDNYTASASEVLAGALQDHTRAIIAGTRTYGKGSVNTLYKLQDGSGLYLTTARWLTPNGRLIEGKGIEPDFTLELEGEDTILWAINYLKSNKE